MAETYESLDELRRLTGRVMRRNVPPGFYEAEYLRCVARGTHSERTDSGQCVECGYDLDSARLPDPAEPAAERPPRSVDRMWEGRRGRVIWRVSFPGVGASRMGGGWKWKIGAQGASRTVVLYLLIVTVRLDLEEPGPYVAG